MRFVSYLRVSTDKQGSTGLGIEAQRESVANYAASHDGVIVQEYVEVETGKRTDRPQLEAALAHCRLTKSVLLVAKVDRLARNTAFLLSVVKADNVVFCDLPQIAGPMGRFMITQMAAIAELEAGLISQRTKDALAAAKARGVVLGGFRGSLPDREKALEARQKAAEGFAGGVAPIIAQMQATGSSLRQIALELDRRGISTRRGGNWSAQQVKDVLARAA